MELVSSTSSESSHKKYLEDWNPNEGVDPEKLERSGIFYDFYDTNPDIIKDQFLNQYPDLVSNIKPKDFEKAFKGGIGSPFIFSPEPWQDGRANLFLNFPGQGFNIIQLYKAYNIQ